MNDYTLLHIIIIIIYFHLSLSLSLSVFRRLYFPTVHLWDR